MLEMDKKLIKELRLDANDIQDILDDDLLFNEFFEELECNWDNMWDWELECDLAQERADNSIRDRLPDDEF